MILTHFCIASCGLITVIPHRACHQRKREHQLPAHVSTETNDSGLSVHRAKAVVVERSESSHEEAEEFEDQSAEDDKGE